MLNLALIAILSLNFANAADFGQFSAEREFPNYFKGQRIEPAMSSLMHRMQLTVETSGGRLESVAYFPYVQEKARTICPEVRVYASGGVVRSFLGYLYEQMYLAVQAGHKPGRWLQDFANNRTPIPAIEIRGVGSDLDVLVDGNCPDRKHVIDLIRDITNSAEKVVYPRKNQSATKSFFTFADAKDYRTQIERSTRQGGSEIDFLAFDSDRGQFIEPPGFSGIVDRLLNGTYRYLPPSSNKDVEDADKQTVRGLRPFLELPFLRLEDDRQFRIELIQLASKIKSGQKISPKALEQFHKMVRNSRRSGANNRFYRSSPGSIEEIVIDFVNKLSQGSYPLLPEFADRLTIGREVKQAIPQNLLLPITNFFAQYTDRGMLYHGTPNPENGFAILRHGLMISDHKQGQAAFGRGVYTSRDEAIARRFAMEEGLVFSFKVKSEPGLRILDWPVVKNSDEIKRISQEAERNGRDVFELLTRDYGVDIIINTHVLIQNLNAIDLPKPRLSDIAKIWYFRARDNRLSSIERLLSADEYQRFMVLAKISGESEVFYDLDSQIEALTKEPCAQIMRDLPSNVDVKSPGLRDFILSSDSIRTLRILTIQCNADYANFTKNLAKRIDEAAFDSFMRLDVWNFLKSAFTFMPELHNDSDFMKLYVRLQFSKVRPNSAADFLDFLVQHPDILRKSEVRRGIDTLLSTKNSWPFIVDVRPPGHFSELFRKMESQGIPEARYWSEAAKGSHEGSVWRRRLILHYKPARAVIDCMHLLTN